MPAQSPRAETLEASSRVCLACHAPGTDEPQPSAAAGALWLGAVRVPNAASDAWEVTSVGSAHRGVPGGCVGCHGAKPAGANGGVDHSFRVQPGICKDCHTAGVPAETFGAAGTVQARAEALAQRLAQLCPEDTTVKPNHAGAHAACPTQPLRRARYEVELVREDPAAALHNAAFARSLLDDAERLVP